MQPFILILIDIGAIEPMAPCQVQWRERSGVDADHNAPSWTSASTRSRGRAPPGDHLHRV